MVALDSLLPDLPRLQRLYPHFCVVQVNNVFNMPKKLGGKRLVAYPHPLVHKIRKSMSPKIPPAIQRQLTPEFYDGLKSLVMACLMAGY